MRWPTWRPCCDDDGRPHHVRLAVRVLGRVDQEILEFRWGPDWLVWDAQQTKQQYAQHVEYTLRPDLFIPDYFIKRAGRTIIDAANEGLRQWVLRGKGSDLAE